MRSTLILCMFFISVNSYGYINQPALEERAELVGIVFNLAGSKEYQSCRVESYSKSVEEYFGGFKDHEVVHLARKYRADYGISYDAVMNYALHLNISGQNVQLDPALSLNLDNRWEKADIRYFTELLDEFYTQTSFNVFFQSHKNLYQIAEASIGNILPENVDINWFSRFYGSSENYEFKLVVSLICGPNNYGGIVNKHRDGNETVFAVIGVYMTDEEKILYLQLLPYRQSYMNIAILFAIH